MEEIQGPDNDNQDDRLSDALMWLNKRYTNLMQNLDRPKSEEAVHLETIFSILMQLRDSRIALMGMCKLLLDVMDQPPSHGREHIQNMTKYLLEEEARRE